MPGSTVEDYENTPTETVTWDLKLEEVEAAVQKTLAERAKRSR